MLGNASLLDGPTTPDVPAVMAAPAASMVQAAAASASNAPAAKVPTTAALDVRDADHPDLFGDPAGDAAAVAPTKVPPAHPRIFDASQNTSFDPLRNKSFDLNTAKTIPAEFTH